MTTQPINPADVKPANVPDAVIEAFNTLIQHYWDGKQARFKLSEAVTRIADEMGCNPADVYSKQYLDIEPLYRQVGWAVEYDGPAYNESYPATFTFSLPKKIVEDASPTAVQELVQARLRIDIRFCNENNMDSIEEVTCLKCLAGYGNSIDGTGIPRI